MKYDELLNSRRIRREKASPAEIEHALNRAERDLKTAQTLIAQDRDWGFAESFVAMIREELKRVTDADA